MAYQNILFPALKLLHGVQVERERPTSIVTNFAKEYRLSRFANTKTTYVFPARNITIEDWTTLKDFFESVGWERDSFNLDIPADGASTTVKVRLSGIPSATTIALDSSNVVKIVNVSEIRLKQVFNE